MAIPPSSGAPLVLLIAVLSDTDTAFVFAGSPASWHLSLLNAGSVVLPWILPLRFLLRLLLEYADDSLLHA